MYVCALFSYVCMCMCMSCVDMSVYVYAYMHFDTVSHLKHSLYTNIKYLSSNYGSLPFLHFYYASLINWTF